MSEAKCLNESQRNGAQNVVIREILAAMRRLVLLLPLFAALPARADNLDGDCLVGLLQAAPDAADLAAVYAALGHDYEENYGERTWHGRGVRISVSDKHVHSIKLWLRFDISDDKTRFRRYAGRLPFGLSPTDTPQTLIKRFGKTKVEKVQYQGQFATWLFKDLRLDFQFLQDDGRGPFMLGQLKISDENGRKTQIPGVGCAAGAPVAQPTTGCVEGTCGHGKGAFVYPDGRRFDGSFRGGKMFAAGKLTFPNGLVYEGTFNDDNSIEGWGTLYRDGKKVWVGAFKGLKRHGRGLHYGERGELAMMEIQCVEDNCTRPSAPVVAARTESAPSPSSSPLPASAPMRQPEDEYASDPGAPPLAIRSKDDYGPSADIDTGCRGWYGDLVAAFGCTAPEIGRGDAPFSLKQYGRLSALKWCGQRIPAGWWVQYGGSLYIYRAAQEGRIAPTCRRAPAGPRDDKSPNVYHCPVGHGVPCGGVCCESPRTCHKEPGIGGAESCW